MEELGEIGESDADAFGLATIDDEEPDFSIRIESDGGAWVLGFGKGIGEQEGLDLVVADELGSAAENEWGFVGVETGEGEVEFEGVAGLE